MIQRCKDSDENQTKLPRLFLKLIVALNFTKSLDQTPDFTGDLSDLGDKKETTLGITWNSSTM